VRFQVGQGLGVDVGRAIGGGRHGSTVEPFGSVVKPSSIRVI
jgi:hypothetical protein